MVNLLGLGGQLFFWLMAVMAICFHRKDWRKITADPLFVLLFYLSFLNYLVIGITVPYLSAILRYKCIYELSGLLLMGIITDWNHPKLLSIKNKLNINLLRKKQYFLNKYKD